MQRGAGFIHRLCEIFPALQQLRIFIKSIYHVIRCSPGTGKTQANNPYQQATFQKDFSILLKKPGSPAQVADSKQMKKIKILNKTYKIKYTDEDLYFLGQKCYGQLNKVSNTITINTGVNKEQIKETLLHEILHAIYCEFSLKDEDKEEEIVTLMARGLRTICIDNDLEDLFK